MRWAVTGMLMIVFALAGILLAFQLVTVELPVHFGLVFGDYPDPDRPGHLKGVVVSLPRLLAEILRAC